jgi:small redox-active disulfide protein 2
MARFGKKYKIEKTAACSCGDCDSKGTTEVEKVRGQGASIKILGSGCAKCNALEKATKAALEELKMDTAIDHLTDFAEIAAYGVMTTPALVVDGKVVSSGKVLKTDQIAKILQDVRG